MAVTLDTQSTLTTRKQYTHRAEGDPTVEVSLSVNSDTGNASAQIRISGATGAAQINQVLALIINKIRADFNL